MHSIPSLPQSLMEIIGPIEAIEVPPQGTAFQVAILTSVRGQFVLKVAHTPALSKELASEVRVLSALQEHVPFVAQPLGDARMAEGHAFLFSYVEGDPLYIVLQTASAEERYRLVEQFARALRCVHSWTPDLPFPGDWLTETLRWLETNIMARSLEILVQGTNSRFDGIPARQLLADIQIWRPQVSNDIVFGHYDYCLPNVLVQEQHVTGIIDWSGGAHIDRRFDLATALFSLRLIEDLAPSYLSTFLQAYGYIKPVETLHFFETLHALTCAFWQ